MQQIYQEILANLQKGGRPSVSLRPENLSEIKASWEKSLNPLDIEQLSRLLCILRHSKTLSPNFDTLFWRTLSHPDCPSQILILTLGTLSRQIIDRCEQRGERLPSQLAERLRPLLSHPDAEVFEWSLRTVELMGPQGVLLKKEILQRRWGLWRLVQSPPQSRKTDYKTAQTTLEVISWPIVSIPRNCIRN